MAEGLVGPVRAERPRPPLSPTISLPVLVGCGVSAGTIGRYPVASDVIVGSAV